MYLIRPLFFSKDFKALNNSTLCKLWCSWLYILNQPVDLFTRRHGYILRHYY